MGGAGGPVVVKLGGSFACSAHLGDWIETLTACAGRVVIVPGGGPFADAVRSVQARMGIDDKAAHHMAVLAMEQYGRALVSLDSLLSPADSADAIKRDLTAGRVPVWMPARMVLAASDIDESWEVSSDSLAAWLTGRIGARRLLLIKHGEFPPGRQCFDDLAAAGVVDKAFPRYLTKSAVAASVLGPSDHHAAMIAIREGAAAGIPIQ